MLTTDMREPLVTEVRFSFDSQYGRLVGVEQGNILLGFKASHPDAGRKKAVGAPLTKSQKPNLEKNPKKDLYHSSCVYT